MTPARPQAAERALELAYAYLNPRERTEAELRRHLERQGVDPGVGERALAWLREQGAVDDARYARLFAQDKRDLQQWGSERITRALLERGIEPELVAATVDAAAGETELDRAVALLRRRYPAPPGDRRGRERALGLLLRKGYDHELALDALARHAGAAEVELPERG